MQTTFGQGSTFFAINAMSALPREDREEQRWIARAKSGDEAAYRWLLDQYRAHAVRVAAHVLRSDGDCEDVAQEAFIQAFRHLSSLRTTERFGTWLYKIVVRQCLSKMRRMPWQRESSLNTDAHGDIPANIPGMDQKLIVECLLDQLSPPIRAALVLRELEGLEYEEIAAVLEIPVGTVRSRLNAARAQFRSLWQAAEENDARSL